MDVDNWVEDERRIERGDREKNEIEKWLEIAVSVEVYQLFSELKR